MKITILSIWNQIAPNTESGRAESSAEGAEPLTEVCEQDIEHNANLFTSHGSVHARFEGTANKQEIPPEQYRAMLRGLNDKQRQIVMFHRAWCKKAVLALKQSKPIEPYHVFLSGPGGRIGNFTKDYCWLSVLAESGQAKLQCIRNPLD